LPKKKTVVITEPLISAVGKKRSRGHKVKKTSCTHKGFERASIYHGRVIRFGSNAK